MSPQFVSRVRREIESLLAERDREKPLGLSVMASEDLDAIFAEPDELHDDSVKEIERLFAEPEKLNAQLTTRS